MKIKQYLCNVIFGFIIGFCMLIPGMSGGSVAVLLGIYDDLLWAVSKFFSQFKKSFMILSSVAIGGLLGFVSMAKIAKYLLCQAMHPTIYFFMGLILGGIFVKILEYKSSKRGLHFPMLILGAGIVFLLKIIPYDLLEFGDASLLVRFVIMVVAGLMLGGALILPGISFSMTLMTLGLYESFLNAIDKLDVGVLFPIIFSTIFGTIVLSNLLSRFMSKLPNHCNSLILGFVIASLFEMFPGIPQGSKIWLSLFLMASGVALILFFSIKIIRKRA